MDTELFEEFFRAFTHNALITLHVTQKSGRNAHHIAEGCFKALARALRMAAEPDPRAMGRDPLHQGRAVRIYTAHIHPRKPPVMVREGVLLGGAVLLARSGCCGTAPGSPA